MSIWPGLLIAWVTGTEVPSAGSNIQQNMDLNMQTTTPAERAGTGTGQEPSDALLILLLRSLSERPEPDLEALRAVSDAVQRSRYWYIGKMMAWWSEQVEEHPKAAKPWQMVQQRVRLVLDEGLESANKTYTRISFAWNDPTWN